LKDAAITLGEAFHLALRDKRGIERYGFCLPMDDCLAQVAIDFGGRNWCVGKRNSTRNSRENADRNVFSFFQIVFRQGAVQFKYQG
jgi:imidazoleglycerol-phosphate dehydratase/histidinol-phosphatase